MVKVIDLGVIIDNCMPYGSISSKVMAKVKVYVQHFFLFVRNRPQTWSTFHRYYFRKIYYLFQLIGNYLDIAL